MIDKNGNTSFIQIVVAISFSLFITNLDVSIVNVALPTLSKTYNVDVDSVSRVILVYVLGMASFLPVFGKISDIKGSEKIFNLGYLVFAASSVLCALSTGLVSLNVFRFFQGIGSAMLLANFAAIIIKYLPVDKRGKAFGISSVFGGVGMAAGLPIGGFLVNYFSWRWIFFINIPASLIGFVLAYKVLKREPSPVNNEKFDILGAVYSIAGLMSLLFVLNTGSKAGWLSLQSIVIFIVSLVFIILFIRQERQSSSPLLDLGYLKNLKMSFGLVCAACFIVILDGLYFLFPFYFEFVCNFSPAKVGLTLMVGSLTSIIVSPLSGHLADKYKPRVVTRISIFLLIISNILFLFYDSQTPYWFIIMSFLIFGVSLALFFAANSTLIMSHAQKGKEGMLSSLSSVNSYLATLIGVCLFSVIFSYGYSLSEINASNIQFYSQKLLAGYKNSIYIAIIISLVALISSYVAKESEFKKQEV
ncbi:MAG: MFS transporter [Syntrophomonas sp.]